MHTPGSLKGGRGCFVCRIRISIIEIEFGFWKDVNLFGFWGFRARERENVLCVLYGMVAPLAEFFASETFG